MAGRESEQLEIFGWGAAFELGIAVLDRQHRTLVELVNQLGRQRVLGASADELRATLDELAAYAELHFATEDDLMAKAGLPEAYRAAHAVAHGDFAAQIDAVVQEGHGDTRATIDKLLSLLVFWLATHVLGEDKQLAQRLGARRRGEGQHGDGDATDGQQVLFGAFDALYRALAAAHDALLDAQAQLRSSMESQLNVAQRLAKVGSWELDWPTQQLRWSDETYRIFELDPAKFGANYQAFLQAVHPDDRQRVDEAYAQAVRDGAPYDIEHRLQMADGRIKYVHESCETVYSPDGTPLRSIGTVQDVTERVEQAIALHRSREHLRTVADYTYDWEYWRSPAGDMVYVSPSCLRVTGYGPDEFLSDPKLMLRIVHPDDRELVAQHLGDETAESQAVLDFRVVHRNGATVWISHACQPVKDERGRSLGRRASNRDITERKVLEQELQRQATMDYLTGIANRRYFIERCAQELARSRRHGRPFALIMIDVDLFKQVNDRFGHGEGDRALQFLVERCQAALRQADVLGRLGGEEFAVLLAETDLAGGLAVAERMRRDIAAQQCLSQAGEPIALTVSIGVTAVAAGAQLALDDVLSQADRALYAAKALGRNRVCTAEDAALLAGANGAARSAPTAPACRESAR